MMRTRMLSKDEEATAAGGEENEVRREDQEKINRFSRLHQRESVLEELLKGKNKDKEDLEEVSMELELADEDDLVPYKIGDTFFQLPLAEAQSLLSTSTETIDGEVAKMEESLGELRDELQQLKVALYARFGRSINLEV
ncbi:Prefoldin, subunit 4 [Aspergillus taichungensis]|uniref:Prefoldin subunit 4 n=1 Tax=Aspergillus taichungensis TaxID=482145 RepID=A0A2J5I177_9EURO|nr:Prefoldin, subunit 4 [Aspergillus taichungensis]